MRIELFGAPAIRIGEERFEHRSRKVMALLAYLAMRADEHLPRSHLAALLWGDSGEEQARANLRQTLSQLRKLFKQAGHDPIMVPFDKVVLASDGVTIDARSVLNGGMAIEPKMLAAWPDFLEGFSVGAPEFDRWMAAQRSAIQSRLIEGLEKAASDAARKNKHAAASENLAIALKLDPLQEALHRRLMESLAAQGKSDEALAQYNAYRNLLEKELQIEPDAETRALASKIRANRRKAATEQTRTFRRYPSAKPVLVFAFPQGLAGAALGAPDRHGSAEVALRDVLNATRQKQGGESAGFAVLNDTGDEVQNWNSARELLAECRTGEIIVDPEIYDQFQNRSLFTFERISTDQGEKACYRLLSEMPSDRFPVVPIGVDKPTIAILPFTNLSSDAEQEYFADGITEDIITALSNVKTFTVLARNTTFVYKGKSVDARELGRTLDLKYMIEGSVRRAGNRVRVAAQLIDTTTGDHLWADRYDGTLDDIFEVQDRITSMIVGTIEPELVRAEGLRLQSKPPDNMGAYDYLLRGLAFMHKVTPEDTKRGLACFERAIELDPNYGRAYAFASWCYRREVEQCGLTAISVADRKEATRLARKALQCDRSDPFVLIYAAITLFQIEADFDEALALIERAISMHPNSLRFWNGKALIHAIKGETKLAIEAAKRAITISPNDPAIWNSYLSIAQAHLQELRYEEASDYARRALRHNENLTPAYYILAAASANRGKTAEAESALVKALKSNPGMTLGAFLECYHVKQYKNLDTYLNGLRKAGLPD